MSSKNVVEVFLDGKKLLVQQVEVSYSVSDLQTVSVEAVIPQDIEYSVGMDVSSDAADAIAYMLLDQDKKKSSATIKEINKMCRDRDDGCETACEDRSYGANRLAKRVVDIDLSDEEKLIRKYNLTHDDGTLTERGKELLLTILFDLYNEEVVEALQKLEDEDKPSSEDKRPY